MKLLAVVIDIKITRHMQTMHLTILYLFVEIRFTKRMEIHEICAFKMCLFN